jgi:heme a synthase
MLIGGNYYYTSSYYFSGTYLHTNRFRRICCFFGIGNGVWAGVALCNGEVIPILENATLIEFAHRVIGLLLAILVVSLFVLIKRNKSNKMLQTSGNWLVGLLTLQILAGAVVVVLDLSTIVITVHLLVAMLFMLVLLWIYRTESHARIETKLSDNRKSKVVFQLYVLIILLLLTMGFGAFIKHEYFGLACGWLDCRETLLPVTTPEILQTVHRVLAVITASYTILLMFKAYLNNWGPGLKKRLLLAAAVVVIQIISGILTIVTNISIPWAVVHLAIGTALFMIVADTRLILGLTIAKNTGKPWTDKKGQPFGK